MASCCLLGIAHESLGYEVYKLQLSSCCLLKEKMLFEIHFKLIQLNQHL